MKIGGAVEILRAGGRVTRNTAAWKGMWLHVYVSLNPDELPAIMLKTPENKLVPWTCSQVDLLAEDWAVCT
jgi:hypothetical protein